MDPHRRHQDGIQSRTSIWPGPNGEVLSGPVIKVVPFGVFVHVAPGIAGLLHESVLTWKPRWEKWPPSRSSTWTGRGARCAGPRVDALICPHCAPPESPPPSAVFNVHTTHVARTAAGEDAAKS
ncbi:S1 RNA-binding domain-containing protein [Micromonospora auratinigra]|uniref:S1 RNA-binding domain-containing protein n=1 Tax=Micromonospora auratinigra TaxID=261654 RepID=UPI000B865518